MRELALTAVKMGYVRTRLAALCLLLSFAALSVAGAEVQGVIIDRNCAGDILKSGREVVLKRRRECSLRENYIRDGYGIVTDDKHFLKFDDAGNKKAVELLRNTPHKDDLKVVVTGNISGDTIAVTVLSML